MSDWVEISILTLIAGIAMPVGAALAGIEQIRPHWLEKEVRHSVIAFGGGALLAAVALVLVPEGIRNLPSSLIIICFASGGLAFMFLDILLAAKETSASQLVAMLSDFIPEALALGATFALHKDTGLLLAGIIALQNVPEGFNAYRELKISTHYSGPQILGAFMLIAFLGPIAGLIGYFLLSGYSQVVSCIMLFAAGGILYIIFQDIAPQAKLEKHWSPPLFAVAGFLLGVIGKVIVGV